MAAIYEFRCIDNFFLCFVGRGEIVKRYSCKDWSDGHSRQLCQKTNKRSFSTILINGNSSTGRHYSFHMFCAQFCQRKRKVPLKKHYHNLLIKKVNDKPAFLKTKMTGRFFLVTLNLVNSTMTAGSHLRIFIFTGRL